MKLSSGGEFAAAVVFACANTVRMHAEFVPGGRTTRDDDEAGSIQPGFGSSSPCFTSDEPAGRSMRSPSQPITHELAGRIAATPAK
jgi:hypothetical protein